MEMLTLGECLQSDDITADELFSVPKIVTEILQSLDTFVQYCRSHRTFSLRMIQLGLNITYEELVNNNLKQASYAVVQFLSSEETQIIDLFLREHIDKPDENTLQNEAERLFDCELPSRKIELEQYQLAKASLIMLGKGQKNDTCIGYIQKIFAFLIRSEPNEVLQFFKRHPAERKLLMQNINNCSISNLISQMLACEDKTKKYLYADLKEEIVKYLMETLMKRMADQNLYDGGLVLIEQILSSIKQTHFQYFQDFQKIAILVANQDTIRQLYQGLMKEETFYNASRYLEILIHHAQQKADNENENGFQCAQKSNFQINLKFLLERINILTSLLPKISHYIIFARISFITFLANLYTPSIELPSLDEILNSVYEAFNFEAKGNIYKTKIYNLIIQIISIANPEKISFWIKNNKHYLKQTFETMSNVNMALDLAYNKNQNIAYLMSVCAKLNEKEPDFAKVVQDETGKDILKVIKKYETKIANFQKGGSSIEQQPSELIFQFAKEEGKGLPGPFALNIGPKVVSIPILELSKDTASDKFMIESVESQELVVLEHDIIDKPKWSQAKIKFFLRHPIQVL